MSQTDDPPLALELTVDDLKAVAKGETVEVVVEGEIIASNPTFVIRKT